MEKRRKGEDDGDRTIERNKEMGKEKEQRTKRCIKGRVR